MQYAKTTRSEPGIWSLIVFIAIVLMLVGMACGGCTGTVTPVKVAPNTASFDGNSQNSGVLERLPSGSYSVTAHWVDRYNAMVPVYGRTFTPPLQAMAGITPATNGTFIATSETVANFGQMNLKRKSGN